MPRKTLTTAIPDAVDAVESEGELKTQLPQTEPEYPEIPAQDPDNENQPLYQTEMESDGSESFNQEAQSENSPAPQTGMEYGEFMADDLDPSVKNSETPQTELDSDEPSAIENSTDEGISNTPEQTRTQIASHNNANLQTDTESHTDDTGSGFISSLQPDTPTNLQTDTEMPLNTAGSKAQSPLQPDISPILQTDTENTLKTPRIYKTPRRRNTKNQSGESNEPPAQSDKPARRRRAKSIPVLAIDEHRSVETSEDKMRNDLLDLIESQKGKKILSGTIQGVERPADNPNISFAVIYHGAFKIIIPAEETVQPPADFRDRSPADVMHYLVTKRLGAEVDYIIKGVDIKSGIAAASRLDAMAIKRRQYYFGTDRDGNHLIYEGLSAEARVVSVIRAGIFVDLFGLEVYISLRELSYQRWIDAAAHFQAGQRVLVKLLEIDRSDRNNIRVAASVKQAAENPYEQALKKYTPGSRYVGTVSLVDTNGVFVSLDGGIDCLCHYPKRGRPPRGARVTVKIIGKDTETNRIWGAITHMATVR